MAQASPSPLPNGTELHEYRIERVLGHGGFGVTYLARDRHLNAQFAIKEYLPRDFAHRTRKGRVEPTDSRHAEDYAWGLDRFKREARALARFKHPNIVRVARMLEANNTAYMVMDYEQGQPLRHWIKAHGPVDETQLRRMFAGLLDGLEQVHKASMVHRDIKPSNIYVRDSNTSLVLLDFGSARPHTQAGSGDVTSMVTPGFAPFEQYHARGAQGPWSDLYAVGGVLYWLVTGHKPVEAPSRIQDDCLPAAADVARGHYSSEFLRMIDWALAVDERHRPQSVAAFRPVFLGEQAAPPSVHKARVQAEGHDGDTVRLGGPTDAPSASAAAKVPNRAHLPVLLAGAAMALLGVFAYATWDRATRPVADTAKAPQAAASPAAPSAKAKSTPPGETTKSTAGGRKETPQPSAPQRQFACSDLPFALRVTCTIEGKDVIRKCAPDLQTWNHDRPGCQRQNQAPRNSH